MTDEMKKMLTNKELKDWLASEFIKTGMVPLMVFTYKANRGKDSFVSNFWDDIYEKVLHEMTKLFEDRLKDSILPNKKSTPTH